MGENEKPGRSERPGQKPQNKNAVRAPRFAMDDDSISARPLSTPLRPRPVVFVAFDETALVLAQKQLAGFVDVAFWDIRLGRAAMRPDRARFLFEQAYALTFFYPCNPDLRERLNRHPRAVAMPPMKNAMTAAAPMGLRYWVLCYWPESLRYLKRTEAIYVHN
jgi:hypothetical protein